MAPSSFRMELYYLPGAHIGKPVRSRPASRVHTGRPVASVGSSNSSCTCFKATLRARVRRCGSGAGSGASCAGGGPKPGKSMVALSFLSLISEPLVPGRENMAPGSGQKAVRGVNTLYASSTKQKPGYWSRAHCWNNRQEYLSCGFKCGTQCITGVPHCGWLSGSSERPSGRPAAAHRATQTRRCALSGLQAAAGRAGA